MASKEEDINPYELLEIGIEASEADIRKAYRQTSLKVHPDRHPNNPDAAARFHELNQAYELLLDPVKRNNLNASLSTKQAHKERLKKFDAKRSAMQSELEEAERTAKRAKMEKAKQDRQRQEEAGRIQEEGRRMREAKEEVLRRQSEELTKVKETQKSFELGPLDTTVRVKYPLSKYPNLTTPPSLFTLLSPFGTVDERSIVISMKPSKKAPSKPPKFATALIPFAKVTEAHAAVCASGMETKGLKDVEISWAAGKEPPILEVLKRTSEGSSRRPVTDIPPAEFSFVTSRSAQPTSTASPSVSFSFDPFTVPDAPVAPSPGLDYESITLMRLRQAEKARLEREIREQEAVN